MKRKRYDSTKPVMVKLETALDDIVKRLDDMPDTLTTKQEKRKLMQDMRGLRELLDRQKGRVESFIKKEEEFQRVLLEELKKEHINVRPTQGKSLATVVWAKGRKAKPTKPPENKKRRGKK